MREQIDTMPIHEAYESGDECPFCWLERQAEQSAIRYTVGPCASYMEPDVRGVTDRKGFCREHMKKMFDYGNALGNALMMQTYYAGLLEEWEQEMQTFVRPAKRSIFRKKKPGGENKLLNWVKQRQNTCFLCQRMEYNLDRYFATFFVLIQNPEFRELVEGGKGFCMRHFAQLLENAQEHLPNGQREWFLKTVPDLMLENMARVKADLDWLVAKYDYRNASKPWGNSKDALPRAMQKLQGIYPTDEPYREK